VPEHFPTVLTIISIVCLIQFNIIKINSLQEDQNTDFLPLLTVNTASCSFGTGTRLVERLVAYLCTGALVLLVIRFKGAVPHVSAEQVGIAVDADKVLRLAFIFAW
jgi:hypothetical protein